MTFFLEWQASMTYHRGMETKPITIVETPAFLNLARALWTSEERAELIDYVARTPDAIGIIGVNWLSDRNDSTGLSFSKEVRLMSVSAADKAMPDNSYKPYQAYLYYGDYPLARSIYALLNDPRSALPRGFASFHASDRGQRIILKSGLVPATQPVRVVNIKDK